MNHLGKKCNTPFLAGKTLVLIAGLLLSLGVLAQAPDKFNYQGVARYSDGTVAADQNISLKMSIIQDATGGPAVYVETHSTTTNDFGVFSVVIGDGTVVSGSISAIEWGQHPHFLKTEMDIAGGGAYQEMGTTQLVSVPYAAYAGRSTPPFFTHMVLDCKVLENVTDTYQKLTDVGSFQKNHEGTLLEITYICRLLVVSMTGTGVFFQFRIDDQPTTLGTGSFAYFSGWQGEYMPITLHALFPDIGPGNHTLSIWAKTHNNTATNAYVDPGCWPDDRIVIREYYADYD